MDFLGQFVADFMANLLGIFVASGEAFRSGIWMHFRKGFSNESTEQIQPLASDPGFWALGSWALGCSRALGHGSRAFLRLPGSRLLGSRPLAPGLSDPDQFHRH